MKVANELVDSGVPYAYQQLVLLAVLCSTRAVPLPSVARRFVKRALEGAADALNSKLDSDGSQLMICSEFVYRCYAEATPPSLLSIEAQAGGAGAEEGYVFVDDFARRPELIEEQAAADQAVPAGLGPIEPDLDGIDAAIGEYAAAVAAQQGDAKRPRSPPRTSAAPWPPVLTHAFPIRSSRGRWSGSAAASNGPSSCCPAHNLPVSAWTWPRRAEGSARHPDQPQLRHPG